MWTVCIAVLNKLYLNKGESIIYVRGDGPDIYRGHLFTADQGKFCGSVGVNKKNVLASYRINISPQRAQNTFLHVLGVSALHVFQV